jgi:LysM repeat protein
MQAVEARLQEGELAEAHLALSSIYDNPDLPARLNQEVVGLLDQLAGSVIYSREHRLELPYQVRRGEHLEEIAQAYHVPWQLLARINGIADPAALRPGQELKVVRGPFSAVIRLERFELTLTLHGRYAGRFPIGIGRDAGQLEGSYTVCEKIVNPSYYGPDGTNVHADDPNNPLGEYLLDLGEGIALHGTNDPSNVGRGAGRGSIFLTAQDIDDVFHILSVGSRVIIEP